MNEDLQPGTAAQPVKVQMHQAYDLNMTITFAEAEADPGDLKVHCQPRQDAERMDKDPLNLPESTQQGIYEVGPLVNAWLAADENNQHAFLADPKASLSEAGVTVERTQAKALARLRENFGRIQAVVPGLQIRSVRTRVGTAGRQTPTSRPGPDQDI